MISLAPITSDFYLLNVLFLSKTGYTKPIFADNYPLVSNKKELSMTLANTLSHFSQNFKMELAPLCLNLYHR